MFMNTNASLLLQQSKINRAPFPNSTMALRGATKCISRATTPSLLSISRSRSRSLFSPSHPLPRHGLIFHPLRHSGLKYPIRSIQDATAEPVALKKKDGEEPAPNWKIKMLYDGDCPLCMREVNMLQERNKQYGTIKFVDIGSDDYSPEENRGLDYETAMGRIHAILSDGTVVKDVEAFRELYEQVGLGWVYAITKYEPVATLADAVYGVWAKYRLPLTGREPLEKILEARRKNKAEGCSDKNTCKK